MATHFERTGAHQFADWLISTGRLGLRDRATWTAWFERETDAAFMAALGRPPTRDANRPCPLFRSTTAEPRRIHPTATPSHSKYGRQPALAVTRQPAPVHLVSPESFDPMPHLAARLSDLLGYRVTKQALYNWLVGNVMPPAEVKLGLAELTGKPVGVLWSAEVLAGVYAGRQNGSAPPVSHPGRAVVGVVASHT